MVPHNDSAPHSAIIAVSAEVHEVLPNGHLSGRPVVKVKQFLLRVDGCDRAMCERKLNELLAEVKSKCQQN